ncbi:HMG (high mobility group) box protein [Actinidia rufa]|uniref:HMG (High mobility group) box protein n=1 Tax=Actinidia rufa TaxID=165716 RepID=A0A7J0FAF2_9ERIC|nr:HMG (high mobility group) box protein [Actinidia rufa]
MADTVVTKTHHQMRTTFSHPYYAAIRRLCREGEPQEPLKTQENQSGLEEGQTTKAIAVFRERIGGDARKASTVEA